jgi:lipopolysaccharide export system permease protein
MLLVFGRFSADQELTAARASGISLLSLITPVLLLSLLCCGLSAWINMEIGPQCDVAYKNLLSGLGGELANLQLPEGQFIRDFPGWIFYTEKNNKGRLENVMVLKLENETNVSLTITAPSGNLEINPAKKEMFVHLIQARIIDKNGGISSTPDVLSSNLYPTNDLSQKFSKPKLSDMTFWQLRDELAERERELSLPPSAATNSVASPAQLRETAQRREDLTEPVRVEMNRQIAFPFACFGFTLVGIPLGIRVHRRETNIGVAVALGLVLVYYSFIILAESLSTRAEFAPHLIIWLPNFIFQAVGAVLLWRANKGI